VTTEEAGEYLQDGDWRRVFDSGALARGAKLMRSRQVAEARAELFETGDLEITGRVTDKEGNTSEAIIALWLENNVFQIDASCSCQVGVSCEHAVATLEYLAKGKPGVRLAGALGEKPHAETMTQGQHLHLDEPAATSSEVRFLLRVEREGNDVIAQAYALYIGNQVPLEPSGNLPPIVTPTEKIKRDRTAEMAALQALYALDLLPNDDLMWAADKKAWPHPEFYWQRFQHEATHALERRGWDVQFSAYVGLKPLIFRTETWKAEIIEEGRGWFSLSAGFEIDGESFDLQPILAALVGNRFLEVTEGKPKGQEFMIFLPDGRGLALPVGRFRKILTTLGELLQFKFTDGPIKMAKLDAALLAEDDTIEVEAVPEEVKELGNRLTDFERIDRVPEPKGLQATLRDYQRDGYHWIQFLARYGLNGILADDMGLGKTLQTLAHLLAEKQSGKSEGRPSLVIAPTSVVENWQREAAKFAPSLRVLILQGSDRRRRFAEIPHSDLVLTSYALVSRDLETFLSHRFHLFALDEAQHIKNPGAQVTQAVCQLDAKHRLCLSGTPIENNLGELWSLFNFLMPGLLGTQENFNETFRNPIEKNGNQGKRTALAARVGPLILRRTKHDVAKELPPKTEILHTIELNDAQKDLYETVRATMDKQVRQALELQGQQSQIVFLDALLKLRQICCHPQLLAAQDASVPSNKFDHLIDLLDTLRQEGHRVLLFSQFTSMLAFIEAHLESIDCPYLKLTGATKNRQDLVERFQGGEGEVFLISLKAGGTGLTLTGADIVIHYDPWWNPAAENQATDRAYRIGQDKPVFVHKLICKGTVEERIQQMQQRKHTLATDLLSGATQQLSLTPETLTILLAPIEKSER
jgi:superfamily II DNA or RNA helicase